MSTLASQPSARPVAPAPLFGNIPQELKARPQWVCWRYEERTRRDGSIYWTKVPYVPGELQKARSNRPSTWRGFQAAIAAYEQNPNGLDGIGYMFLASDPYVGGDQDHDLSTDRIPLTYAEISPSGNGIKFIARATGDYGRKTAKGELYSHGRFFTITGRVLDQAHAQITDQQEAIEAFHAALGSGRRTGRSGTANGGRAELARAIERATWDAANALIRTQRDRLLRRERAAGGEETQLALVLRGEYAQFHEKWPHVGLYRADGSLDESQRRAVHAYGLRGRGFSFAEYAALMHLHYGQEAKAKWSTIELWKQELAALWDKAPAPRFAPRTPEPAYTVPATPRGRAGDHAALVERVYTLLRDYRVGVDALVKIGEIAASLNVHRRTVATMLRELRDAGRVATRRLTRHGGLVVTFLDVIDAAVPPPDQPGTACNLDVIYSAVPTVDLPMPAPQSAVLGTAPLEETSSSCVSSERAGDHSSDREPPTLAALAEHYLSQRPADIGEEYVIKTTGLIAHRRTARHFAALVVANYGYAFDAAIEAYQEERQRLKNLAQQEWDRFFAQLREMSDADLIAYVGGRCRTEVHELARDDAQPFDKHKYRARLRCAKREMARRRLTMSSRETKIAQQARDDAERAEQARANLAPKKQRPIACEPIRYEAPPAVEPVYDAVVSIARLKAQRDQRVAAHV